MLTSYLEKIAETCHESIRQWHHRHLDFTQIEWSKAPKWQIDSAIDGANFRFSNPTTSLCCHHNYWVVEMIADGWVYGKCIDEIAKTHPCLVRFEDLPQFQKDKYRIFRGVFDGMMLVETLDR
jgi:hypothetical protein